MKQAISDVTDSLKRLAAYCPSAGFIGGQWRREFPVIVAEADGRLDRLESFTRPGLFEELFGHLPVEGDGAFSHSNEVAVASDRDAVALVEENLCVKAFVCSDGWSHTEQIIDREPAIVSKLGDRESYLLAALLVGPASWAEAHDRVRVLADYKLSSLQKAGTKLKKLKLMIRRNNRCEITLAGRVVCETEGIAPIRQFE